MKRSKQPENQTVFDFDPPALPDPERLPTNRGKPKVGDFIRQDFFASSEFVFITVSARCSICLGRKGGSSS